MTGEEVKDLFIATHQIAPVLEHHYNGTATNIAIQDGKDAGQSVEVYIAMCFYIDVYFIIQKLAIVPDNLVCFVELLIGYMYSYVYQLSIW